MNRRPVLLVLRALGLGDLLTAVPALHALAVAFPTHRRELAVPPALAPLALATGAVHGIIAAHPLAPLDGVRPPEVAVNLHGRGPESHRVLLGLKPRRLIAFAHTDVPESAAMPQWRDDEHEVARWCRLLGESGIAADPSRLEIDVPGAAPAIARDATLIHPGAASPARRWPVERWVAVARAELSAGRDVIVTGGAGETDIALRVAQGGGVAPGHVFAGRTDVLELARLVAAAARVVCGDTGVGHLATALATPSVVLFGPTPPSLWGPPPDRPWHRVLWSGRTGSPHADEPDRGLLGITVADVVEALAALPARDALPARAARPSAGGRVRAAG